MIFMFLIIGVIATAIGAAPPGASNLAVIKTTVQENIQESLKVSYGAGMGEVMLAGLAFSFGMMVQNFFIMHVWVQFVLASILGIVGFHLFNKRESQIKKPKNFRSKYLTGFILSIINPPVLVYWIVVFSILKSSYSLQESPVTLALFFAGVFLGKVAILYGYGKLGIHIQNKRENFKSFINQVIGVILMSISFLQVLKLLLF